jgi:pimeloyl-ACP methyl ester carboxylesterase
MVLHPVLVQMLSRYWRRISAVAVLALAVLFSISCVAVGQEDQPKKADKKAAKADDEGPAAPEDITLTTEDGLTLAATYFAGTKGKDSVPVILLHAWKGSRKDLIKEDGLAWQLQKRLGCAVIVPDLRGHGESTRHKGPRKTETLKPEKLSRNQVLAMVGQDLRAVKDYLWDKNNAEELNIDKLCVVGVEMGASLALGYALYDSRGYEQGTPKYGSLKLGRFVKGLVLISPEKSNPHGLNVAQFVADEYVREKIDVMILVGKENKTAMRDADWLCKMLIKYHPYVEGAEPPAEKPQKKAKPGEEEASEEPAPKKERSKQALQTFWYKALDTSLEGVKMIDEPSLNVPKKVCDFIQWRVVENPSLKKNVWRERKVPHS